MGFGVGVPIGDSDVEGIDVVGIDVEVGGDATCEGAKFQSLEKPDEFGGVRRRDDEVVEGDVEGHVVGECGESQRQPRRVGVLDQSASSRGGSDLLGAGEDGLEVSVLLNQGGGGLDSDARDSRNVVYPPANAWT